MRRLTTAIAVLALATPAAVASEKDEPGGLRYPLLSETVDRCGKRPVGVYRHLHGWSRSVDRKATGRNIAFFGLPRPGRDRVVRCGELAASTARMNRWKHYSPPPPPATSGPAGPAYSASGSGGWSIPEEIVMCESGGDYNARNPSGAYGAYQIMPGTAAAYGCDLSTPAGQDACAAKIWAGGAGRSNWVC